MGPVYLLVQEIKEVLKGWRHKKDTRVNWKEFAWANLGHSELQNK